MHIEKDDLSRPEIHALLNEHLANMYQWSPPASVHALDLVKLQQPDITFWSAWHDGALLGCGALKELSATHGEIKSMRTPYALRRQGAGRAILSHIIEVAKGRGYKRLSLETGSQDGFVPARRLYESYGFEYCGPFGDYVADPNSKFMTLRLCPARTRKPMSAVAKGSFTVSIKPLVEPDLKDGVTLGRMSLDKIFEGDLVGTGKGVMLTAMTSVKGSAGYVAIERVTATVAGRNGSFVFQHTGTMDQGAQRLSITVVPDSGTGELLGITGNFKLNIVDGGHLYEFEYVLPDAAPGSPT